MERSVNSPVFGSHLKTFPARRLQALVHVMQARRRGVDAAVAAQLEAAVHLGLVLLGELRVAEALELAGLRVERMQQVLGEVGMPADNPLDARVPQEAGERVVALSEVLVSRQVGRAAVDAASVSCGDNPRGCVCLCR